MTFRMEASAIAAFAAPPSVSPVSSSSSSPNCSLRTRSISSMRSCKGRTSSTALFALSRSDAASAHAASLTSLRHPRKVPACRQFFRRAPIPIESNARRTGSCNRCSVRLAAPVRLPKTAAKNRAAPGWSSRCRRWRDNMSTT